MARTSIDLIINDLMLLISFCRNRGLFNVALKRNLKSPSKDLHGIVAALVRKRCITTESARKVLQLHDKQRDDGGLITRAQLRSSYLQAAMLCHPGTSSLRPIMSSPINACVLNGSQKISFAIRLKTSRHIQERRCGCTRSIHTGYRSLRIPIEKNHRTSC